MRRAGCRLAKTDFCALVLALGCALPVHAADSAVAVVPPKPVVIQPTAAMPPSPTLPDATEAASPPVAKSIAKTKKSVKPAIKPKPASKPRLKGKSH